MRSSRIDLQTDDSAAVTCGDTLGAMTKGIEVGFTVDIRASCRDCGHPIDPERLRGRRISRELESDRGNAAFHVVQVGGCKSCGGGRFAVLVDYAIVQPEPPARSDRRV